MFPIRTTINSFLTGLVIGRVETSLNVSEQNGLALFDGDASS